MARRLAKQGSNLVLNGFGDAKEIEGLCKSISDEFKVKVHYEGADLANVEQIDTMMSRASNVYGGVDVLVNNAGIQHVAPVSSFPRAKWDAIIAINLSSIFHTTQLALPHMTKVSSQAAALGYFG